MPSVMKSKFSSSSEKKSLQRVKVLCRSYSQFQSGSEAESPAHIKSNSTGIIEEPNERSVTRIFPIDNESSSRFVKFQLDNPPEEQPILEPGFQHREKNGETERSIELQTELLSIRHRFRRLDFNTLHSRIAQSETLLRRVKAGAKFTQLHNRLQSSGSIRDIIDSYRCTELDKALPQIMRYSHRSGGSKNSQLKTSPLILNVDNDDLEADEFYQFLHLNSPRAAAVYRGNSRKIRPRKNTRVKRISENELVDTNVPSQSDIITQTADASFRENATLKVQVASTQHDGANKNATEAIRENCVKFNQVKLKLQGLLNTRLKEREISRTISNRAKSDAAKRQFKYRSSAKDIGEMRRMAAQMNLMASQKRLGYMHTLQEIVRQEKCDSDTSDEVSANERKFLELLVGFLQSVHGAEFSARELVEILSRLGCDALKDIPILRLIEAICRRMLKISDSEFQAQLNASGHSFSSQEFKIKKNCLAAISSTKRADSLLKTSSRNSNLSNQKTFLHPTNINSVQKIVDA